MLASSSDSGAFVSLKKPIMQPADRQPATAEGDAAFHDLRRSLSDGAFEPVARQPATWQAIVLATAGLALTGLLIWKAGEAESLGEVLSAQRGRLALFFLFTHLYVLLKACALRTAGKCCGVHASLWRCGRIFCESSLVSFAVAKIAADVYKFARLGDHSRGDRVRTILVYRVAAILSVLLLGAVVSILWAESTLPGWYAWAVPAGLIAAIFALYRTRLKSWLREHGRYLLRVLPYSLGALCAKIAGFAILLGASLNGGVVEVAAAFLLIGSLASMTQVPAGLGTLDAGYAVFLTKFLGASGAETAAFLVALRMLGPVYVGLVGAISMGAASLQRYWQGRTARQPGPA